MKLEDIPISHIEDSVKYKDGTVIVFDNFCLPYDMIRSAKEGVVYFDKQNNLKWIVNGVENQEFWQKTGDCFTGFFVHDGEPVLSTFSGHLFNVDIENGSISIRGMSK
jgi:outer membrane protein assembly factor BamB